LTNHNLYRHAGAPALLSRQYGRNQWRRQTSGNQGAIRVAIDSGMLEYLQAQMALVEPIRMRRMFGGAGFYARDCFFALTDGDSIYFKTDDENRSDYLKVRAAPFAPWGEEGVKLDYYELPDNILDDPGQLRPWMEKSIAAAERAKQKKVGKRAKIRKVKSAKRPAQVKLGKPKLKSNKSAKTARKKAKRKSK
jgi:DNA transformation protein